MNHSTNPPTKEEAKRIRLMLDLGCIITRERFGVYAPAECHHIVMGNRRLGHIYTIPLTPYYHRGIITSPDMNTRDMAALFGASLAHGSKEFIRSHGKTELEWWQIIQRRLGLDDSLDASKVLSREVA
jgi:hypothetical protein